MADKKIPQLDLAGALTVNDYWVVNQDASTGKALKATLGELRSFILGGANAGARIYFTVGAPSTLLGVDSDVAFDTQAHAIYQKVSGAWIFKDNYGSEGGIGSLRFTATYGSGGLSGDGLQYTNPILIDTVVQSVTVESNPLIIVANFGDTPAFDEWDFNALLGRIIFGAPVPAGTRVTVLYSM